MSTLLSKVRSSKIFSFALFIGFLALSALANSAFADDIYHLYGISKTNNSLVEINTDDGNYTQTVVRQFTLNGFSAPPIKGLEYDIGSNRILALSDTGILYSVNQLTAALTQIRDFAPVFGPGGDGQFFSYDALTYDGSIMGQERIFFSIPTNSGQFSNSIAFSFEGDDDFNSNNPENRFGISGGQSGYQVLGLTVDPTSNNILAADINSSPGVSRILTIDKYTGTVIDSSPVTIPISGELLASLAIDPISFTLFGTTKNGILLRINTDYSTFILKDYRPNNSLVAVSDLAFIPVTPTPTPTATPTPTQTFTPSPTPSPTPTTPPCLGSPECGCTLINLQLNNGSNVCAPLDTLTTKTLPDAPIVTVKKRTVTLSLEKFSAASDGKTVDLLNGQRAISAAVVGEIDDTRQAATSSSPYSGATPRAPDSARKPKLQIQYEVSVRKTSARTLDLRTLVSKRNSITLRKLSPGTYAVNYRVKIVRGKKTIGRTRFSPRTKFKVR